MSREHLTRFFLWLAVIGGGILLGAKVFDTVVLAGAWNHDIPASLRYLPYGKDFPVDTGVFFIPVSALLLISTFGAAIAGWQTPWSYRRWLVIAAVALLAVLVFTVLVFWPMNQALWDFGRHRERVPDMSVGAAIALGRRWVMLDWGRIAVAAVVWLAALIAFRQPYPAETAPPDPVWLRIALGLFVALAAIFIIVFIRGI